VDARFHGFLVCTLMLITLGSEFPHGPRRPCCLRATGVLMSGSIRSKHTALLFVGVVLCVWYLRKGVIALSWFTSWAATSALRVFRRPTGELWGTLGCFLLIAPPSRSQFLTWRRAGSRSATTAGRLFQPVTQSPEAGCFIQLHSRPGGSLMIHLCNMYCNALFTSPIPHGRRNYWLEG